MCTIITVSQDFWQSNSKAIVSRILIDAKTNSEGWCLVGIDTRTPENDIRFNSMRINLIPEMIKDFFNHASNEARVFLHARAATTRNVGLSFTHGFTDRDGRIIMHNGIIGNLDYMAVDSFNLAYNYDLSSADTLLSSLKTNKESFANIFVIDPAMGIYQVVRMSTGSLYTDGEGNYSTHPIGSIAAPVATHSASEYYLDGTGEVVEETPFNTFGEELDEPAYRMGDLLDRGIHSWSDEEFREYEKSFQEEKDEEKLIRPYAFKSLKSVPSTMNGKKSKVS